MKLLVTYSSLTGNTEKLARGIYEKIEGIDKEIMPIKEVRCSEDYDIILVGYWVDKGGPNEHAKSFLSQLKGKKVGVFATLGYWADSDHALNALKKAEDILKENENELIGRFICQGKLDERIIRQFEKLPKDNPHAVTPEKRKRYAISQNHPTLIDILSAAELFNERVSMYV